MLTYAFRVLNENGYKNLQTESFNNIADMFAAILITGVSIQIKRGLIHDYVPKNEVLTTVKGKVDITQSINQQTLVGGKIACEYSEFLTDCKFNQIIKSTFIELLKANIEFKRKQSIKKILMYFAEVKRVDLKNIDWKFQYNRNNATYHLLISICELFVKGLLQTNTDGVTTLMDFLDDQYMHRLYEKFILEYYRKEFPCFTVNSSQIEWQLDTEGDDYLPAMQSDIMISKGNKILIIDAKYYEHILREQFGNKILLSANIYQIFTYVKNKEAQLKDIVHTVSGMLLYAKTDEKIIPQNSDYSMSGNRIMVNTLDLNVEFEAIRSQLNKIVNDYFN
jgi:5-methylcytosine-specific restriction enzyme subunit McrC